MIRLVSVLCSNDSSGVPLTHLLSTVQVLPITGCDDARCGRHVHGGATGFSVLFPEANLELKIIVNIIPIRLVYRFCYYNGNNI